MHSTGYLHYWIQALCRVSNALGKGYFALGKSFIEYSTRQRASGKKSVDKEFSTECLLSGTRQRKVTITAPAPLAHALLRLGKDFFNFFSKFLCRASYRGGTRQRFFFIISLPSALPGRHSAKIFLFFFVISLLSALSGRHSEFLALPSVRVRALGKEANFF